MARRKHANAALTPVDLVELFEEKLRPPLAIVLGTAEEWMPLVELMEPDGTTAYQMDLYPAEQFRTALADTAYLGGFALWRVRRRLQGKPDTDPPFMLLDSLRHSIFCTGFELRNVENPALSASAPSVAASVAAE